MYSLVLAVDKKEGEASGNSRNDMTQIKVVVGKRMRERERGIVKKICLTLGFHNGML